MPQVRRLSSEEVYALENKGLGQRKQTERLYDSILADYNAGDYGEAVLESGDNRLTVRNRLKSAAKRKGFSIDFRRTKEDILRFQIVASESKTPEPVVVTPEPEPEPVPVKRRGGRPKKVIA